MAVRCWQLGAISIQHHQIIIHFDVYLYPRDAEAAEGIVGLCFYFKQAEDEFNATNRSEIFDITANVSEATYR